MDMAFIQAGAGDLYEFRPLVQRCHGRCADIAHRRPQAADHLMHDRTDRSLERDLAFNAFGDQLVARCIFLEIAIR